MYFLSSKKFFCTYWFDTNSKVSFMHFFGKLGYKTHVFPFFYYFPFISNKHMFLLSPSKKYTKTLTSKFSNTFFGVSSGYFRYMELKGIGFKVLYSHATHCLFFFLGYNHIISFSLPISVQVKVRKQYILLFSYENSFLSYTCSNIKALRYPDPYRGKGILFRDEILKIKPGKQR